MDEARRGAATPSDIALRLAPPSPPRRSDGSDDAAAAASHHGGCDGGGSCCVTSTPRVLCTQWRGVVPTQGVVLSVETSGDPLHPNAAALEATLRARGWTHLFLGRGTPWRTVFQKVDEYAAAVAELPPHALAVLVDSRDVLCTRGPDANFVAEFLAFDAPIVVSMEMFCDGLLTRSDDGEDDATRGNSNCADLRRYWRARGAPLSRRQGARQFVNSGLVVGYASALLHYLRWAQAGRDRGAFTKDQVALGAYMCEHPAMVAADVDAVLLHTSGGGCYAGRAAPAVQAADSPTMAELHGRTSYFLHVAGIQTVASPDGGGSGGGEGGGEGGTPRPKHAQFAGQLAYYEAAQAACLADCARVCLRPSAEAAALEPPLMRGQALYIRD